MADTFNPQQLHPFCNKCGWRMGGIDSWNGSTCKCGHYGRPIREAGMDAIRDAIEAVTGTNEQ